MYNSRKSPSHSSPFSGSKRKQDEAGETRIVKDIAVEVQRMNPLVVAVATALLFGLIPIIWSAVRISKFSSMSQKLALAALMVTVFVPVLGPVVGFALMIASQVMYGKGR